MATKRATRRRQPFVIEPLDWVAPDVAQESEKSNKKSQQSSSKQEDEQD